jgi:rod shape-determining protein MreC
MQKLFEFLIGKRHWLVFILCEIISLVLVYRHNAYQRNVFLGSANMVAGYVSSVSGSVMSYIGLRKENRALFERNSLLELEVLELQQQLTAIRSGISSYEHMMVDSTDRHYRYVAAEVVNNSVTQLFNYITINRGRRDGVEPDMGVVSMYGIVGIVSTVNDRFSVVIPLLNPKLKISCKLHRGNYYGSLSWDGRDTRYASLGELPNHAEFQEGDTVVTSGYSAVFPPGVIVGTVATPDDNTQNYSFYSLKVKLATDFRELKMVRVIKDVFQQDRLEVEREARKND